MHRKTSPQQTFFLCFLGGLVPWLRRAGKRYEAGAWTALAGGVAFIVLTSAGFTAEILASALAERFPHLQAEPTVALVSLTMAAWLYQYCQIGTAVMIIATSAVGAQAGQLPRWAAAVGALIALLALLHTWIPLLAALAGLVWIVLISVLSITEKVPATD